MVVSSETRASQWLVNLRKEGVLHAYSNSFGELYCNYLHLCVAVHMHTVVALSLSAVLLCTHTFFKLSKIPKSLSFAFAKHTQVDLNQNKQHINRLYQPTRTIQTPRIKNLPLSFCYVYRTNLFSKTRFFKNSKVPSPLAIESEKLENFWKLSLTGNFRKKI